MSSTTVMDYRFDPIPEAAEWEKSLSGSLGDGVLSSDWLDLTRYEEEAFVELLSGTESERIELSELLEVNPEALRGLDREEMVKLIEGSLVAKRYAVHSALKSLKAFAAEHLDPRNGTPWVLRRHLARAVRHAAAEVLHTYYETERERLAETKPPAAD